MSAEVTMNELSSASNSILQEAGKNITDVTTTQMRQVHSSTVPLEDNITVYESFISAEDLDAQLISVLMPMTIFIAVEAIVGLVGNILILYIYSCKYSISNFRYFVLFLAFVDLTSCLTALPGEIYVEVNWYTMELEWICKIKSYFNIFTVWGSGQIIFLMAFDRYRKVCRPLGRQIRTSLARKLGFYIIVISSLAALPVAFLWGKQTYTVRYKGFNILVSTCEKSDEYEHTIYPAIYITFTYAIPVGVLMLAAATLNILVVRTVFCNLKDVQDIVNVSNTSRENVNNESGGCVRCESNSLQRENEEISATDEQRYVEQTSICIISESVITQSFNEFLDIREFTYNGIFIPEIKHKDVYQTSKTETHEVRETESNILSEKCVTKPEYDAGQVKTKKLSIDSDVNFQTEQILSRRTNKMSGQSTAVVQKDAIKSVKSTLGNGSNNSLSEKNDSCYHSRVRKKTVIMLILTSVFVVTTIIYAILISFVAQGQDFLQNLSNTKKVFFFFFFRLYFINSVINPILYGILDPRFRQGLKSLVCSEEQTG